MRIKLSEFGGMIPRDDEQYLPETHGREATNTDLDSGELRPLIEPTLEHVFAPGAPDAPDPTRPDPIIPPAGPDGNPDPIVPPPEDCIPPELTLDYVWSGESATFSAPGTGTPPLTYRWFLDGVELQGKVEDTLTLSYNELFPDVLVVSPNIPKSEALVSVLVTNPCGQEQYDWQVFASIPPECEPYGCAVFENYVTTLFGEGVLPFNLTGRADSSPVFPQPSGTYVLDSTMFSADYSLVTPGVDLADPCVTGDWARVTRSNTFVELAPPRAIHLVGSGNATGLHAAVIVKNNPSAGGDPVTASPTNLVTPAGYQGSGAFHRVVFSNGTTVTPLPANAYGYLSFRRDGDVVTVVSFSNGSTDPPESIPMGNSGPLIDREEGTLVIPAAAWEDWMVISVSLQTSYSGGRTYNPDGSIHTVYVIQKLEGTIEFAYNANAGTSSPPQVAVQSLTASPDSTVWGRYFHVLSDGSTRLVLRAEKFNSVPMSFMDNSDCLLAGIYTSDSHINAAALFGARLQNRVDYVVPDYC